MFDAARLHADAQQAEISAEMARSRSEMAKASLSERSFKCSKAKSHLLSVQGKAEVLPPPALSARPGD